MTTALAELRRHIGEVVDLQKAAMLLEWDASTKMPPRGAATRASQLGTLSKMRHQLFTSDLTGRLLDAAEKEAQLLAPDSDDACLVRWVRRDYEKTRRVPVDLASDMAQADAEGYHIWTEARPANDFARLQPVLERQVALRRRYADLFPEFAEPFDVLFDDLEQGMTAAEIRVIFDRVKEGLVPLVRTIAANPEAVDDSPFAGSFPKADQEALCIKLIGPFGYDPSGWRFDETHHPFEMALATGDVRITTRYSATRLNPALFGTLHEAGHGLFEAGVSPALERTPLCHGCSLALHESQSRLWENMVGRGRPYWSYAGPILRDAFPAQLGGYDDETLYRAANRMAPSLIRVEADETTYSLHIILRFEIERDLLAGKLAVADLPEIWNAKMKEYLGVEVPNNSNGVMQDVHWPAGGLSSFSNYALGNIIGAQIWDRVNGEIPDLDSQFERGEFTHLRGWLTEHLYRHGRKFTPKETVNLVAGGPVDPEPYLRYLTRKVESLYGQVGA